MPVSRQVLVKEIEDYLNVNAISDYCPNGLQVEGKEQIKRIVSGVTASQALIEAAIELQADALLVHHGYFWKGEDQPIVGMKQRRIKALLAHDINLLAYHLPLDVHPEVGNNVQLAQRLGLTITGPLEPDNPRNVGLIGELNPPLSATELATHIEKVLDRAPLVVGHQHLIKRVAWCTGGAQSYIEHAIAVGADAYITGEVSERTFHEAKENGISFFAAGHHATERYGVQALGEWLAKRFAIEHHYVECDNPV
ncbi:Nif3-like dinuclear metal center hexameric protein [Denitrificimonas sp. JX-1]|uniref:Nif3-like dinuclear metal center hexameric protein n=1 Tax=Denitrificimonas halotolerans TaxID=3098930 RepID=A0ABU5GTI1_9GAMM|nr:Nif3-like dinuclear metal center hexameric protein [Denitrificimonas sp. JX-1]MDY7219541.1 Nif3-like dinuclear metal center hexameric protein [Denitrificimonas sp. JX-1]